MCFLFAQTTNISGIINNYTAVTSIPVCNPCSNTCNYLNVASTTGFAVGDKVLIIQMKGATTDLSNTATFGTIQSVGNAGLYEYKTIASIAGTTLTFTSTLYNIYDVAGLVQVVRVPQYVNATVTAKLTAQAWNGATGGILVFDVSGTLTLNADADVTALGFRGGIGASNGTTYPNDEKNYFYTGTIYELAAPKGEGIAAMISGYELGRGAYANAGGGGNAHNGGGGGGSNAGAGGLGGNQYNTFTGSVSNGIGGYAISYTAGDRMYMGGGGGAGHQNNTFGTDGGNGGGMIFINAATIVGNSHKIIAAGDSSKSTTGGGNDGAGGGGGGGAIKINATSFTGTLSLIASGGKGGDNTYTATDEHAPGGGGGGGIICLASAATPAGVTTNVLGGAPGLYRLNGDNFGTTAGAAGQVLNACNFVIPSGPKELKPNLGSDIQLCNPIVANLDARLIGSWYTYTWYKNNVLISGATAQTYSTNETGRFKVVVSSAGCTPGVDSVDVTTNAATAVNATFCAPPASSVLLKVTGAGQYKWWDAATAGSAVGKGLTFTTPAISTTKTYYVEDTALVTVTVGPTVLNNTGLQNGNPDRSQLGFSLTQDIEITSLRVPFVTDYSPPTGYPGIIISLEVVDEAGNSFSPALVFTSNISLEPVLPNISNDRRLYTFTFNNFKIPASLGSKFRLKLLTDNHPNGSPVYNMDANPAYPFLSSIPDIVSINGTYRDGSSTINTTDYGFFYDWQFKTKGSKCLRVPVVATLSCTPTCAKPTSVSVQLGTGVNDTLCVGNALLIKKNLIDTSTVTSLNGFYFSWRKINSSGSTIIQGPSKTYSDLSIASVAITDSGRYYLVVQDGLVASPTCKDSAFVTIRINRAPTTKARIASHQEICKGDAAAAFTEIVPPANYAGTPLYHQWYTTSDSTGTPTLAKISAATAVTYNAGSPVITQYYVRKDSVKYCAAVATNFLKIRVNNSVVTDTILPLENDTLCVSAGSLFQLKGVVDSTGKASINHGYHFTWMKLQQPATVPVVVGTPGIYADYPPASRVVAEADSGTYYLIIRDGAGATVCQDTLKTKVVVYLTCTIITPTCKKPVSVSTALIGNDTLCVGNGFTIQKNVIDLSAGPALNGYYYSWRRINSAGSVLLSPPSATYSDLTLTNITQADSGRYYLIVQDGIGSGPACKDSSAAISIVVNAPIATPVVQSSDTICQGNTPGNFIGTIGTGTLTHYQWYISTDSFKTVPASQAIVGAISDSYQSSALSTTSYFIRKDSIAACPAVKSNILTIQVEQLVVPGVIGNDSLICSGSSIPAFKEITAASGGTGVFTYQWQGSGDNVTFSDIPGETNNIYQSPALFSNTYFRRIDLSGVCSKITDTIAIVVNAPITGGTVIGASDTICQGSIPDLLAATASGVPDYYQWYISTDSFKTAAASQLIAGATAGSYQSGALSSTSYFIRKDSVVACPAISSNILTIQVDKPVVPGVVGNDTVVCSGSPILAFKEITATSGGTGVFNYQWQSSSDNVTFTDIPSATNNTYQSPIIISRTYFRRIDLSGVCSSQITDTIFVDAVTGVDPGAIAGTYPTICYGASPAITFTNVTGASHGTGGPGSETYQWQVSTDNVYWTDIASENGLSYSPTGPFTDTMYYRREVGMGPGSCDTSYTASLALNVFDPFVVGSIPTDITVCEGTSVTINELTPSTGGQDPAIARTYEWIESTNKGLTWTTSAGISNQVDYTTPTLTDSIWYRRVVTVVCNKDTSNIMKINVDSINTVHIAMADVSTCAGTDAVFAPTYSGEGVTPTFDWYSGSSATGPWAPISGTASYTVVNPQALDNGTYYRVVLTSSFTCNSGAEESVAQLTVNTVIEPVVGITSNPSGPICDSTTSITYTAAAVQGDAGAATYQWYDGVTNSPIASATGKTYTPAVPPANGDKVYVIMTSDATCASPATATSNEIRLDVLKKPAPIMTITDTTICSPYEVILLVSGITSGSNHFQWYRDGVLIQNANQITYTASVSGKYTFIEDNTVCSTVTDTATVNVLESPSVNAGTDITAVEGETISLNGSVSSNTANYVWIPNGGLSDAHILNPSLVVPGATTVYVLAAYNNSGKCSSSDAVTINVEKRIVIPNVITVNGDGANDTWFLENIENFPDVEVLIYNRWGNLVWKSNGYVKQWDGTNYRNGEVLPDGTYFYIIDLHSVKVKNAYSGWVQIIK
ncbi:gliding motility-associated C-terminal domain-containing protein [Cytophaga aurantiaca]|uniref:gliding motility-associated C-terminal domain-containing protein n=1 Tax=Cytophaga aurantiaca TaxID=29530 RepID=UPI00036655FF|nr:T9SS C-terminal target domain-containing protein [Cytophaga aurantiaca]